MRGLLCAAALLAPAIAMHAAEPARPVRIIVPFLGGTLSDNVARMIAKKITDQTARPFAVENRPGDDGHFGAEVVSKAEPDGTTVLLAPITNYAAAAGLNTPRHYDLTADFAPVTLIANAPHALLAHPSLPVKTVAELIAMARARPGQLRWASHGPHALSRLETEMFRRLAGVKVTGVPYAISANALPDLVAGNVDLLFDSIAGTLPYIRAGRLRALAVASAQRSTALARVPTVAEAGVKGFAADYWYGVLAPDGVSKTVIDRLHHEFAAAADASDIKERLQRYGIEPQASSPDALARVLSGEIARWTKVIKDSGIRTE